MLRKILQVASKGYSVLFTVSAVTGAMLAIRSSGWLQPLEWAALDTYFQLRPQESPDNRILIVGVEESDIQKLGQWPISDRILASLLTKIKAQSPQVIGLDIYRDVPINPGYKELIKVFKSTPNLIGVGKVIGDKYSSKIAPPPILKQSDRVSAVDVTVDGDGVIRRGFLFPMPAEQNKNIPSLGLAVALSYLKEKGVTPKADAQGFLKLRNAVFRPLEANDGGYVNTDADGYQLLINYRGPAGSFPKVSLTDILENQIPPNLMRDRIILIGAVAGSLNDSFYTPYSRNIVNPPIRMPGVEIHANIASQIISQVLDSRSSIEVWSDSWENFWLMFWSSIITILAWIWKNNNREASFSINFFLRVVSSFLLAAICLIISCYLAFLQAVWIPVVTPFLALCSSTLIALIYTYASKLNIYLSKLKESNIQLEQTNQRLTLALEASCTGIFDWDLLNNKFSIFDNCELLLGLEIETFDQTFEDFLEYVHPEDRKQVVESTSRLISDRLECNCEFRIVWSSGTEHWMYLKGQVYYAPSGDATRVVGTITNITDLKLADKAVLREVTKWRALSQNSSDIVTILGPEFEIWESSASIRRILGYTVNEVIGQNWMNFVHPDDISFVLEALEKTLGDPTSIFQIEYRHLHKEGYWRFVESVGCNLLDEPAIAGIVLNSRDITERKQTELALTDMENCLARLLKEYKK
jgi:PAS domain S-box-containing protein